VSGAAAQQQLLTDIAERSLRQHRCPSIAWGVVEHGALAVSGAAGTLDDDAAPDEHTAYRIASMTKSFTAAAVLSLRDEGALDLDRPIVDVAPELGGVVGPADSAPVALRHLLSMSSGLATDDAWADRHLDMTADELDQAADHPLFAHRVGESFEYSNLGYALIGRVVRRATGTPLQEHVTERLLQPLGLRSTSWTQPSHLRCANPRRELEGEIIADGEPLGDGEMAPMGGVWSTISDLARWVAWLDAATSQVDGADDAPWEALSPASRREMQRMHTYVGNTEVIGRTSPAGYGFGLNMRDDPDLGLVIAHSGGLPGYGSNMRWLKGRGLGVIALANMFYAPMHELTLEMLVALHGVGALPAADRPPITEPFERAAHRLVALLNDWSDEVAAELFADNVALDEPLPQRARAASDLIRAHGPLRVVAVRPSASTRGAIDVRGTGEAFSITLDLAPLAAATVQSYQLTP
jgi:CubicO group peptidase (beta-lactamase class C family)